MKKLIGNVMRAIQEARERRINDATLAQLDPHALRDIGLDRASERARLEASRYRLHFGLF